ncbi:transporter substrate-binding domain-containing protein [Acidipila sp. EB88]|uniref:transporter substrate-binding domain-containing protein n=1 Tax=Acidipila sp. EB88 TaxID=2305226 RepID=UPI0013159A3F|nr:transporter substrate-binding domain-containing protein [Acidipila sp. EB88]
MAYLKTLSLGLLALLATHAAFAGPVLDRIHTAKSLACGVIKEEEDYSRATDHGNRAAFDLDLCKAAAVATLGLGANFTISVFPDEPAGVKALKEGRLDLLASASPSLNNTAQGLGFAPVTFHDGETLMVPNSAAVHSAADLAGKKICFVITSQSEAGLRTYAARKHISYIWYPFSEVGEMEAAFFTGNCAGLAGDVSQLANTRAINRAQSANYTILADTFRHDPLAPAYRSVDPQFAAIVNATVELLFAAEALGVTRSNVDAMASSEDPEIHELLGHKLGSGSLLNINDQWGAQVIKSVGNYGEMFDRDLGKDSPLRIDRGADRLWEQGGVLYPMVPVNQ